jgi:hypothetical protein
MAVLSHSVFSIQCSVFRTENERSICPGTGQGSAVFSRKRENGKLNTQL